MTLQLLFDVCPGESKGFGKVFMMYSLKVWIPTHAWCKIQALFYRDDFGDWFTSKRCPSPQYSHALPSKWKSISVTMVFFLYCISSFFFSHSFYFLCDIIFLYISATFSRYKMCNFLNNYLVSYWALKAQPLLVFCQRILNSCQPQMVKAH